MGIPDVNAVCTDRLGSPFDVRQGAESDGAALFDYKQCVFSETELLLQAPDDFQSDPEREALFLRRFHQSPNSLYLLAAQDDCIVGTLSLFGGLYRRNRHVAQLGMGVLRSHWARGIGTALLEHAISWAGKNPVVQKIGLQVYHTNERAIRLYERKEFRREGVLQRDVVLDDGSYIDLVVMGLTL